MRCVDRNEARDRLTKLREEFATTVEALRQRLAQPERDASDIALVDQHPADVATETSERELDASREAMFEARLRQIDDAFGRLKAGTYGTWSAGMQHFGWFQGETIIQLNGDGPWLVEYVNPADDPRKAAK